MHSSKGLIMLRVMFVLTLMLLSACAASGVTTHQLVDLNSATSEQLARLPEIKPLQVEAIVAGRPWNFTEGLVKRRVVTQSEYDAIKNLIVAIQHSPIDGKGEKKKIH